MNQALGELSDGRVAVVESSNEFGVSRYISVVSPFHLAEEEIKWITIRHFHKFQAVEGSFPAA